MIRMMVIAGACAGFFASAASTAQSLYKCADPQGRSSYQSTPCSDHGQQVWAREMPVASTPSPAPPTASGAATTKKAPVPAARSARSGGRKTSRPRNDGAVISLHGDPVACEKAKEKRRKTYEKLGLKRNFETSRKMDDLVYDACR